VGSLVVVLFLQFVDIRGGGQCVRQVYAVGDDYAYAEARKSPTVDGVVERRPDGKECRWQVSLSDIL